MCKSRMCYLPRQRFSLYWLRSRSQLAVANRLMERWTCWTMVCRLSTLLQMMNVRVFRVLVLPVMLYPCVIFTSTGGQNGDGPFLALCHFADYWSTICPMTWCSGIVWTATPYGHSRFGWSRPLYFVFSRLRETGPCQRDARILPVASGESLCDLAMTSKFKIFQSISGPSI